MNIDSQLNEKLKKLVERYPCSYSVMLSRGAQYKCLYDYVMAYTEKFPNDITMPARIYYVLTGSIEPAKCKVCGNDIPHTRKCNAITGYASLCCSPKCAQLNPDYRKALEERNIAKYGTRSPMMSDEKRRKMRETLRNMPSEHWETANAKRKNHNNEKYGCDSVSQLDAVKEKVSAAWQAKTKDEIAIRTEKIKATKRARYSDENYCNPEKARLTAESKRATDADYDRRIAEKRKNSMIINHGVPYAVMIPGVADKAKKSKYVKSFEEIIAKCEHVTPVFDAEHYAMHRFDELQWKCSVCGNVFQSKVGDQMYYPARCPACHPMRDPASKPETELLNFLKSVYGGTIIENSRSIIKPNELDAYVPDLGIAFEFDGLYWHSEDMGTPRNYHLEKTKKCASSGIRLIHVMESEWKCRREIVEGRIKNIFGIYDKTVFARKCEIRTVPAPDARLFQVKNHLQGFAASSVNLGLYFENDLVSLMTFCRCRFDKKHEWEMVRFCCKLGYHIPGAAGRLLKFFERSYSPKSIVTYADRRWSAGKLYRKLGFSLTHESKPDYWYWNHAKGAYMPESRIKYQKHKLKGILEKFDENKSERENMRDNGYFRIYDCGNLVFEKTF